MLSKDKTGFQKFSFGTQVRKSPFSDAALRWGATGFSVYNHMYIPRDFGDPVQNFWNLVNEAILCDVAVERQVEITGPTPRGSRSSLVAAICHPARSGNANMFLSPTRMAASSMTRCC